MDSNKLHPFHIKDANKIMMALAHLTRCGCIVGYKELFFQRFDEKAKLDPEGKVDVEQLAKEVCAELGVEDPVR